ncbi:MAG: hypothetical protein BWY77_01887 [bacterium ADurb.Bin431]|nr:MAG: hypothetical protein BWY77_01887 [bacterium ADurb.Bin431]
MFAVGLVDDADADGYRKNDGRAHHGAQDEAGVHPGGIVDLARCGGQLFGEEKAAHVIGQQGGGEHGGAGAEELVERDDDRAEQAGQHRGQADHTHHGQGKGPHGVKALLELGPCAVKGAAQPAEAHPFENAFRSPELHQDAIQGAQHHECHHDVDDDLIDQCHLFCFLPGLAVLCCQSACW